MNKIINLNKIIFKIKKKKKINLINKKSLKIKI